MEEVYEPVGKKLAQEGVQVVTEHVFANEAGWIHKGVHARSMGNLPKMKILEKACSTLLARMPIELLTSEADFLALVFFSSVSFFKA